MPSPHHLQRKRDELQEHYEALTQKIKRLRSAYAIEAGASVRFQLEKEIENSELERDQVEQKIEALERDLDELTRKQEALIDVVKQISRYEISSDIPLDIQNQRERLEQEIKDLETDLFQSEVVDDQEIAAIRKPECFVIMPFRDPFNDYYKNIIKPAAESVGYEVIRADEVYHPTAFIQTIWDCILKADVVIAEMTGMNPNVLYELGLCHAINRTVIMITQKIDDVPSDLRHINNIRYDTTRAIWVDDLKRAIQRMILNLPSLVNRSSYLKPIAVPEDKLDELNSSNSNLKTQVQLLESNLRSYKELNQQLKRKTVSLELLNQNMVKHLKEQFSSPVSIVSRNNEPDTYILPLGSTGLTVELLEISEGDFIFGEGGSKQRIFLPSFYIGKYSITNTQFCAFLNEKGNQIEGGSSWIDLSGESPADKCRIFENSGRYQVEDGFEDHPVTYVNWYGANSFCQWAGVELPSDQQWEKAARGIDGRSYPWGNAPPNSHLTNYNEDGWSRDISPKPVNQYEAGRSPFGCYQMIGNVWHWTSTFWTDGEVQAVRGGSFFDYRVGNRSVYRFVVQPNGPDFSQSFVVCKRWLT
ncbi:SUMF1/EgtB/PvdO family nonheme iron enzyme [Leptolyngbya sp. AN03gr2]|uniref:SUMF1/EgtB/PvdO family nonheme iron enzyme n=1 Tax=unclassified Leptolyngbya TaxID=2650499 RepID=UPI003D316180